MFTLLFKVDDKVKPSHGSAGTDAGARRGCKESNVIGQFCGSNHFDGGIRVFQDTGGNGVGSEATDRGADEWYLAVP